MVAVWVHNKRNLWFSNTCVRIWPFQEGGRRLGLAGRIGQLMMIKTKEYKGLFVYKLLNDFQDQVSFYPLQEGFSGI